MLALCQVDSRQKNGRIDIKYRTTYGKNVIVELKRADRLVDTAELLGQVQKYNSAMHKLLADVGRANEPIEIVCIVGRSLRDWNGDLAARQRTNEALRPFNARVILYGELIERAYAQYQEFLERSAKVGRLSQLISSIDEWGLLDED